MSKIRNLFNKFFKKNKNPQDLEEEFFSDVEGEALDEIDIENELSEADETQEQLLNAPLPEIPLDFDEDDFDEDENDLPPETVQEMSRDNFPDLPDDITENSSEDETSDRIITVQKASADDIKDYLANQDASISDDELNEEFEEENIEELIGTTREIDLSEFNEDSTDSSHSVTKEFNLKDTKLNLKDKFDHLKTRFSDKFRNLNKRDLNSTLKIQKAKISFEKVKAKTRNINWAQLPMAILGKKYRNQIHKYFQATIIICVLVGVANTVSLLLSGSPDYRPLTKKHNVRFDKSNQISQSDINTLKNANLFKTEQVSQTDTPKKNVANLNVPCKEATKKSSAGIKLISTIVLQDSVKSIASVQKRSSSSLEAVREGETIVSGYKLDRIESLQLIVKNLSTGECESIENESRDRKLHRIQEPTIYSRSQSNQYKKKLKNIKGIETDGNNFKISKKFLESKMEDIGAILTQAKGVPLRNPDGTISFKITEVDPGGVFAYLGIENNDIITQLNGQPIKSIDEVMNMIGTISNISNLSLSVSRGGEEKEQSYTIKE